MRGKGKNTISVDLARNETNDILRSLADRGKENISMKVGEITLHRNTLKELNSEIRETIKMMIQVDLGDEFKGEIMSGLNMLRTQVKRTQSDLTQAELELSSLKLVDASTGPSLKKRGKNNTVDEVVLSDSSDAESSRGIIDDESNGDKSNGKRSIPNDFDINPDAADDNIDQY